MQLPPLSLYVHVPWCPRKCPYCDFNSHTLDSSELPEAQWLARIMTDLDAEREAAAGRPLVSIFLGGGTPSLLSAETVARLLNAIADRFTLAPDTEITLEANPGTVEAQRFSDYRASGVNRLSLGVQSFDDTALTRLGRIHNGKEARQAITFALTAGFDRLNIDLMHGLPGQTPEAALADLDIALDTGLQHLSWYQLTIEHNTAFYSAPPALPDETILDSIEKAGRDRLTTAGLKAYEVSAWARPGEESRHNLNYWCFGDYLGVGPGAHGKITSLDRTILRTRRTRTPQAWFGDMTQPPARNAVQIPNAALAGEFMMNILRLTEGAQESLFETRTGLPLATIRSALKRLRSQGLLHTDRLAVTATGARFLDRVVAAFLD